MIFALGIPFLVDPARPENDMLTSMPMNTDTRNTVSIARPGGYIAQEQKKSQVLLRVVLASIPH